MNQKCFHHQVINLVVRSLSKTYFLKKKFALSCRRLIQIMLVSGQLFSHTVFILFSYLHECLSRHFVSNSPLISLSLHLRGRVVTKGRDITNFVKSQPFFDINWQYLWTFLIDLQADFLRFGCRIFHCFGYFLIIIRFYLL